MKPSSWVNISKSRAKKKATFVALGIDCSANALVAIAAVAAAAEAAMRIYSHLAGDASPVPATAHWLLRSSIADGGVERVWQL
jgi:hypothetical protein